MTAKVTTSATERLIVELYNTGSISIDEIAKRLSISPTPVQRVLRENNIAKRPFGSWVSGVPKTTNHQQEEMIVELYKSGLSKQSIEDKTGIGRTVVQRVLLDWGVKARSCGGVRPYNVRSDCFDDLRNEQSAYWLGFLFAELSIERTNIMLCLARKDEEHLFKWKEFIGCEKPIRQIMVGKYPISRLDVSDRILADKIRELGIRPNRPDGEKIIDKIPIESLNHFLRGWFDGDGSAYKFPQLSFTGRPPFLMEVQKIFIKYAFANPVTLKKKNGSNIIQVLYYKGVNRCNEIANYMYRDATIFLPRKRERILNWPPKKQPRSKKFWS